MPMSCPERSVGARYSTPVASGYAVLPPRGSGAMASGCPGGFAGELYRGPTTVGKTKEYQPSLYARVWK